MTTEAVLPPHDLAAERAVLGAALQAPHLLDDLTLTIAAADFYHPAHELVWNGILDVHQAGNRPDVLTVFKKLGKTLDKHGGASFLHSMTTIDSCPTPAQGPYHAGTVRDLSIARRMMDAGSKIRQIAETTDDIRSAVEDCRRVVDEAATSAVSTTDAGISAADLVTQTLDAMEGDVDPGIPTGWSDLDDKVNGLRPGQLIVIGARPSVGKSVIAANLAAHACKAGAAVHFASLEMTRREVMQRLMAAHATVNLGRLINHSLTEADWAVLAARSPDVMGWPLWIDDTPSQSLLQLRARARTTARRRPLGMIVVDYLQLMSPRDRRAPREQQVGELSEGLKGLAKEMGVPVVALAQVNRGSSDRTDKKPLMSDLRESGRIEADADHVWLLHRQDLVDPKSMTGEIEVIVAKNRNGEAGGTINLAFQGHYSRATALARHWPSGETA